MSNKIGIYLLKTPTGKCYVGMTCDSFENRWQGHLKELRRGVHKTPGLLYAYKTYGWDAIEKIILEKWDRPETQQELELLEKFILKQEKHWWESLSSNGHNMLHSCPTGTGSVIHSEETRRKISNSVRASLVPHFWPRDCIICGKSFKSSGTGGKYCSDSCKATRSKRKTKSCAYQECSRNFTGKSKYCSLACKEIYKSSQKPLFKERYAHTKIDKSILRDLYLTKGMSTTDIAYLYSTTAPTIQKRLRENGIPIRTRKEALRLSKNGG